MGDFEMEWQYAYRDGCITNVVYGHCNEKPGGFNNLINKCGSIYYHRDSKVLFFYDSRNSRIESEEYKIDTSKTLLDKLNDKFMK